MPSAVPWLGPSSGAALTVAAALFLGFILRRLGGKLRLTWGRLICAAGVWMLLWAAATLIVRSRASAEGPGTYSESVRQLLMSLAMFGFVLNTIYGFGLRLLSGIVGSATPRGGAIEATFWLHNAATVLLAVTYVGWMDVAGPLGVAALAAGAFSFAAGMRSFVPVRQTAPRPEVGQQLLRRYVHVAFFWLLAGLLLLMAAEL